MKAFLPALVLCAAACGNNDNVIVGDIASGDTTPQILFDNIGSAIHGILTPRDAAGNPAGDPLLTIILSDVPNLCSKLTSNRDYFRNATEPYEALVMFVPSDSPEGCTAHGLGVRLGTFTIGQQCDLGTGAEIIAASGQQVTTPFHALTSSAFAISYIALTTWDPNGEASGSFNLPFDDPYGTGLAHLFYGRFKTNPCPTLEGTLLP